MKDNLFEKENEDFDDDNLEDDFDEEEKANPLVAAGIFFGLIVLVAIICAIVWGVTHRDSEDKSLTGATETMQDAIGEIENLETEVFEVETAENETAENETVEHEGLQETQSSDSPGTETESESISGNESMEFTEISDTVTAKDVTNLRSVPSTLDAENIVAQLLNGDTLIRTGINDATGWSRLEYNGQTVYAVSGYLSTDLDYKPPVESSDPNRITTQDGRVILFTDCDDYVRPKEYVNLRTEPSTSQGESTVRCQISHADIVHRTGYSPDSGWSRVEFYGETLYVVSSYVYNNEETE